VEVMNQERKTIGSLFKDLRKSTYLTQEEFADEIKLSRSIIGNLESGYREPNLQQLLTYANFFGFDIDEFIFNRKIKKKCRIKPYFIPNEDDYKKQLSIGIELKRLRYDRYLGLVEEGLNLKISPQVLSNYENGKSLISLNNLIKFSYYFKVSLEYLIGFYEEPYIHEVIKPVIKTPDNSNNIRIIQYKEIAVRNAVDELFKELLSKIITKKGKRFAIPESIDYKLYNKWIKIWDYETYFPKVSDIQKMFDKTFPNWKEADNAEEVQKWIDLEINFLKVIRMVKE
jgi:transcriptional regulator with XRE-family HTH domain